MCASQAGGGLSRARRFSPHHGMMHNHMVHAVEDILHTVPTNLGLDMDSLYFLADFF